MDIKVLGTGCARCFVLEKNVREAVKSLGLDATIEKVDNITDIINYGVKRTPGLVIDGKIVLSGRIPDQQELKDLLTNKME